MLLLAVEGEPTPVDFNDETKYMMDHTSSTPPTPVFDRETKPMRGIDGEMLVSSTKIATEISFTLRCVGAGYQAALDNLAAVLTRLDAAEAYSKPKRTGSKVQFIRQVGDQAEPQVYDVEYGDFARMDEALESRAAISGVLTLRCSPIPKALTPTEICNYNMCNYDHWIVPVGGSEPVSVKVLVKPLGDAPHYDFIRVGAVNEQNRNLNNVVWPMYLGLLTPEAGYTVSREGADRFGGAVVHVVAKGLGQYQLMWRTGGGDEFPTGSLTTLTDNAAYQTYNHGVYNNPATELPFTVAEFNAGQWGVRKVGTTEVRITQIQVSPRYVERELLTEVVVNLAPSATGALSQWTITGASAHAAVAANDGDTSYLSSTTDAQLTYIEVPDYTAVNTEDAAIRASMHGAGTFQNGGMEGVYTPAFGADIVNDPLSSTAGWSPRADPPASMGYNGPQSAIQMNPIMQAGYPHNSFSTKSYSGLTPGVPTRFQMDLRTLTGAPPDTGCWVLIQDGSDHGYALRQNTTTWTTKFVDFIPKSEGLIVYIGVEGVYSSGLFRNLVIKPVTAYADGWEPIGTCKGHEEVPTQSWYVASPPTPRVFSGESAQGIGQGDSSNYVGQTFSVIDGETYKVVGQMWAEGYSDASGTATTPFYVEVVSGANSEVVSTIENRSWTKIEITQVADGDSMTIKGYASAGSGGVMDGFFVQHVTAETDEGRVAFRVTIPDNVVDHYGSWQVWSRMKVTGGSASLSVRFGGEDGQLAGSGSAVIEESTGVRTARIGSLVIPATPTAADAPIESFTFSVILNPETTAAGDVLVDFDCVELFPADNYIVAKNGLNKGPAANQNQVFDPGSNTVYVANASGSTVRTTNRYEGRFIKLYPGDNLLLVRVSRSEVDDQLCPEDHFDICLQYTQAGILSAPAPVVPSTSTGAQWWIANFLTNHFFGPATNPQFAAVMSGGDRNAGSAGGTQSQFQMPIAAAGTIEAMRIKLSAAPGVGNGWIFTVGSLSGTISGTATTVDVIGTQAVAAGDLHFINIVPTGNPGQVDVNVAIRFTPTAANQFVYGGTLLGTTFGQPGAPPYHTPLWHSIVGNTFSGAESNEHSSVAPVSGTIRNLRVRSTAAPGGTGTWVFRVWKNGVDAGSVTLTGANTAASATLAIPVIAGDRLVLKSDRTIGTSDLGAVSFGLVFEPTVAGQFIWAGTNVNPTTLEYYLIVGKAGSTNPNSSSTENANLRFPAPSDLQLVAIAVQRQAPLVSGVNTMQLRKNGIDGTLVASIPVGDTKGVTTGVEPITAGQLLNMKSVGGFGSPQGNPSWAMALISV